MFNWCKSLIYSMLGLNKAIDKLEVMKKSSPNYKAFQIADNKRIMELVFELQFNKNERYIAFQLSRAFDAENIVMDINELSFFKELVYKISTRDLEKPLSTELEFSNFVASIYRRAVNPISQANALYAMCYEHIESRTKNEEHANANAKSSSTSFGGYNSMEELRATGCCGDWPPKNKIEDLSIDELLSITQESLK